MVYQPKDIENYSVNKQALVMSEGNGRSLKDKEVHV